MSTVNKKAVNWLIFAHFIIDCYPGFIAPMLPYITAKIGTDMSQAMVIISIANISSYFLQPVFGYWADKCNKRFFIFWGIMIASVFIPMMGLAKSYAALTIAIVLGEIGVGFFHPQSTSFVPKFCSDSQQSKWNVGCFLSMGSIGYGVGSIISTRLYDLFGEEILIFTSIIGILTALSMFVFVPKIPCRKSGIIVRFSLVSCIKNIFSLHLERILITASIIKSLIVSSYTMIMPFFWKNLGFNATKIGIISCLFLAASTAGMIVSPKLDKYIGSRNVFYVSFISILPLALITVWLINININLAVIIYSLIGFMIFLTQPINVVLSQKLLPEYTSLISGVVGGFTWGIVGVLLPLISKFAEFTGILTALIIISAIPLIFCYRLNKIPNKPIED